MLRTTKQLQGFKLGALDGEFGRVQDFYFDDAKWTIRYLLADTGAWLTGRQVLISPHAITRVNDSDRRIDLNLTKEKIENCPSMDSDKPVSRQHESDYHRYYGWPAYWYGPALWGPAPYPVFGHGGVPADTQPHPKEEPGDPHLRSVSEVTDYHIEAIDGEIGHVADFLIGDRNWAIRYLLVDTRNWLPGKKVLFSPAWITDISWDRSSVRVDLPRETIQNAPAYQDPITREYEAELFSYYKQEAYWTREEEKAR